MKNWVDQRSRKYWTYSLKWSKSTSKCRKMTKNFFSKLTPKLGYWGLKLSYTKKTFYQSMMTFLVSDISRCAKPFILHKLCSIIVHFIEKNSDRGNFLVNFSNPELTQTLPKMAETRPK